MIESRRNTFWIFLGKNKFVILFFIIHVIIAILIGRFFGFAPDEEGYLFAFNHVYVWPANIYAQSGSGWISAPTIFLWIIYLPAKILNFLGIPDYISIRIQSILYVSLALIIWKSCASKQNTNLKKQLILIFTCFSIPTVFFWTTTGLRESFILLELTLIFLGIRLISNNQIISGWIFTTFGSFGLLATKNYLWLCCVLSLMLGLLLTFNIRKPLKPIQLLISSILLPLFVYALTTTPYTFSFIYKSNIIEAGQRSGDSINKLSILEKTKDNTRSEIELHGNYTILSLQKYIYDQPNTILSQLIRGTNFDEILWGDISKQLKLQNFEKRTNGILSETSSEFTLENGKLHSPLSIVSASFNFIFGKFPLVGAKGLFTKLVSIESPIWWSIYIFILFDFCRHMSRINIRNLNIIFPLLFLSGFVLMSALVEVNLGTAIRHRAIIIIPIISLYISFTSMIEPKYSNVTYSK